MLTAPETVTWILRIAKWDGLLPAVVWTSPILVQLVFPNVRGAIELVAVALPIAALLLRYLIGKRHIDSNRCSLLTRRIQMLALCVGSIVLMLIDSVMILTHVMPKGAAFATTGDVIVWGVLYAIYILSMTIAMYPGCAKSSHVQPPENMGRSRT
jgi:hypothetical protein